MQEVKRILREYEKAKENIETINSQIETINTHLAHITTDYSQVKVKGARKDDLATSIDRLTGLKAKLNEEIQRATDAMANCIAIIDKIEDKDCKKLLTKRYIDCKSWEQVAVEINYSWSQTHNIHNKALQEAQKHCIELDIKSVYNVN